MHFRLSQNTDPPFGMAGNARDAIAKVLERIARVAKESKCAFGTEPSIAEPPGPAMKQLLNIEYFQFRTSSVRSVSRATTQRQAASHVTERYRKSD